MLALPVVLANFRQMFQSDITSFGSIEPPQSAQQEDLGVHADFTAPVFLSERGIFRLEGCEAIRVVKLRGAVAFVERGQLGFGRFDNGHDFLRWSLQGRGRNRE